MVYVYSQNRTQPISGGTAAKPLCYPNKPMGFMYVCIVSEYKLELNLLAAVLMLNL